MPHVVTSAADVDGNGNGALLAFDFDGRSCGTFSEDTHIADPRGLATHRDEELLFLNSGSNRVLRSIGMVGSFGTPARLRS
jgi:hypothetical protein